MGQMVPKNQNKLKDTMSFVDFFMDPLFRGPFIGSMLISFVTSILGVTLFVQRRSLMAETLSHATYPGVILGAMCSFFLHAPATLSILTGGIVSALLGLALIQLMTKRFSVYTDATLTFVLATFFALGIVLSSYLQSVVPYFYQTIKSYIFGQTSTLTDTDIYIYAFFSIIVVTILVLFYKEFKLLFFDATLAKFALHIPSFLALIMMVLTTACIVLSMRSVGVILISGLLIAPALVARQCTNTLSIMFLVAGLIGALSAFSGNVLSFYISQRYGVSLPTGPTIVMVVQSFALVSLLFAPKKGLVIRYQRICRFQFKCMQENLLKTLWHQPNHTASHATLRSCMGISPIALRLLLIFCRSKGLIDKQGLTAKGQQVGGNIVRLHRLWELYLVEDLGMQKEQVHKSAEEMEHILTPELAHKLTFHLKNPLFDPHNQPIPRHQEDVVEEKPKDSSFCKESYG
jgi:manganese/zinc/iron transport system permease protein